MHSIGSLFASNWLSVALANLGGLIGLAIVLIAGSKRLYRFAKSVWQTNIANALRMVKRVRAFNVALCSSDLHYFLSHIFVRLIFIISLVTYLLLLLFAPDVPSDANAEPSLRKAMTIFLVISKVCGAGLAMVTVFYCLRTVRFLIAVGRRRKRLYFRNRRDSAAAGLHVRTVGALPKSW